MNASSVKTSLIRFRLDFFVCFFVEVDGEAALVLGTSFDLWEMRNSAIASSRSDVLTSVCGIMYSPGSGSSLLFSPGPSCKILPDGLFRLMIVLPLRASDELIDSQVCEFKAQKACKVLHRYQYCMQTPLIWVSRASLSATTATYIFDGSHQRARASLSNRVQTS